MAAVAICTTVLTAPPASAATITHLTSLDLQGTSTKPVPINAGALYPFDSAINTAIDVAEFLDSGDTDGDLWGLQLDLDSIDFHLDFDAPTDVSSAYTDGLLTEGETTDIAHTLAAKPGTVELKATVNGAFGVSKNGSLTSASTTFSPTITFATAACTVPVPGTTEAACTFAKNVPLIPLPIIPGIVTATLTFGITASVDISPTGFATVRTYEVTPVQDVDGLSFSSPTLADPYATPCLTGGKDLTESFADSDLSITPSLTPGVRFFIDWTLFGGGLDETNLYQHSFSSTGFPSTHLTDDGPDGANLGTIAMDTTPPVINVSNSFSGSEGTPIAMAATVTDPCGQDDVVWHFSDGSSEFGPSVNKTFNDNGPYTGNITAVDLRGNKTVKNFSVNVSNADPVAAAGLDTNADWGRPVAFNGQATDKGANDLNGAVFTWNFGDGSPSATGAKNAIHSYAAPGLYTATLTVMDKDGATGTDTRDVTITQRDVTASMLGATAATYDTATTLRASLVDEYGQNLVGRTVAFIVDAVAKGSSNTASNGIATVAYTPTESAGPVHPTGATFAGDTLYKSAASANNVAITQKATTVTYTGALTGSPNKTVVLSAKLLDATGKPLAGKSIAFQLGTQSASATTDANGIAVVSPALKLSQKNGTYALTATYTPTGGDTGKYVGSVSSNTFKLQAK